MSSDPTAHQAHIHLDVAGATPTLATPADDTAFCLAILADVSGHDAASTGTGSGAGGGADARSRPPVEDRPPRLIDRDDLDAVLAGLAPTLRVVLDGTPVTLRFTSLDDFHPDRLYQRLPLFEQLRALRRRLADPGSFADAAADLAGNGPGDRPAGASSDPAPDATSTGTATADVAGRLAGGGLLDAIVGAADDRAGRADSRNALPTSTGRGDELVQFLRRAVRPHLVPTPDPRQQELLAAVDQTTEALLRQLLAHPAVRALEAVWRGLDLLVRRVETGPMLRLAVFDVARSELAAATAAPDGDPLRAPLARMLARGGAALPEPAPWSAMIVLERFATADAALLAAIADVGAALGTPVIAGAGAPAGAAGASGADDAWTTLRTSTSARWLALVTPALLLRLPWGDQGEPADDVRFEELEPGLDVTTATAGLLWGSPALAAAIGLASAFAADGWRMRPDTDIGRFPLYLHHTEQEVVAIPPTAHRIDDEAMVALLGAGVMPLLVRRDDDAVRLARWQSIAHPAAPLAGRWAAASR